MNQTDTTATKRKRFFIIFRYLIIGVFFGAIFPVWTTYWDLAVVRGLPINLQNIILVQTTHQMHWIVDLGPLVVGLFAAIAGYWQSQMIALNTQLTDQIEAFAKINTELEEAREELIKATEEKSGAIERKVQFLQAAAEVGKAVTSIYNQDELLNQVTELITEQFDFYQAGIFLIDDRGEYAHMRAANSAGGKKMLARGHKLQVGKKGIVGFVTGIGQPRIAQATEIDTIHSITAELPETRSEMALPLKARGEILGALDIQHNEENAFSDEDVVVLQTLANQIALAISNAQFYQQSQQSIKDIQSAYGEFSQETRKEFFRAKSIPAYMFSGGEVTAAKLSNELPNTGTLSMRKNNFSVPIRVRGELIGEINIQKSESDDEAWLEKEISLIENLTDQLGVALDSAQLFQITQRRAATEQAVSNVTARIRETLDIETIINTAAEEVRNIMDLPEVTGRLATPEMVSGNSNGTNSNGQEQ